MGMSKKASKEFKTAVAMAALESGKTINVLASEFKVLPQQVFTWAHELLEEKTKEAFSANDGEILHDCREQIARLYKDVVDRQQMLDTLIFNRRGTFQ